MNDSLLTRTQEVLSIPSRASEYLIVNPTSISYKSKLVPPNTIILVRSQETSIPTLKLLYMRSVVEDKLSGCILSQ